jgi:hypothetical protein
MADQQMAIVVHNKYADTSNLSADAILCQNCSLCQCSKDVKYRKLDILET